VVIVGHNTVGSRNNVFYSDAGWNFKVGAHSTYLPAYLFGPGAGHLQFSTPFMYNEIFYEPRRVTLGNTQHFVEE